MQQNQKQSQINYHMREGENPRERWTKGRNLIENEALALAGAAADGDNANGALNELKHGDGLRVHPELSLVVGVHQTQWLRRTQRSRVGADCRSG